MSRPSGENWRSWHLSRWRQGRVARVARVGLPDPGVVPHPPGQHAPAIGAERDLAVVDPVVGGLGVVGRPADGSRGRRRPRRSATSPPPQSTARRRPSGRYERLRGSEGSSARHPGRPLDQSQATISRPSVDGSHANAERGDRFPVGREGRVDDHAPRSEGRPDRLAGRDTEGPRARQRALALEGQARRDQ